MKLLFDNIKVGSIGSLALSLPRIRYVAEKPGPKIVMVAGQHGNEVSSLFLLRRWLASLSRQQLNCGSLVILPIANPLGLIGRQRFEPLSGRDINRSYPGGSFDLAQKIAATLVTEAKTADLVIDLHNFTSRQSCFMGVLIKGNQTIETKIRRVLKLIQPDLVWQIDVSQEQDREQQGALDVFLNQQEIPACSLELPGPWYLSDMELARFEAGLQRLLVFYGLLGEPIKLADNNKSTIPIYSSKSLYASASGLFWPKKEPLMEIRPGDEIGVLTELPDFIDSSLSGPSGTILTLGYPAFVQIGAKLATIGEKVGEII